ncbi:H-NS family nucleoid-associated regulatory protein [Parasedimentitalea huanghaiensis]|uniref:H-NS histone family protein n=1 Tax=Parasedimentitalea huanghaiensis TaxID=2682100 RepID=A0A6L6WCQ9_9RHOB|nr:H-NS histone family protein [Zongyanglinia huanghaiensis]MVO15051.1 H-NS histone family protein [Zongyanglinia huanghaiensis]
MTLNLAEMSRKDLLQLKTDVDEALKSAEQRERLAALKAAEQAAAEFGFSLEEISNGGRSSGKRSKAAPKYRNPANPEETWTGRGRKPHWIHTALTSGADISDLEI